LQGATAAARTEALVDEVVGSSAGAAMSTSVERGRVR